MNMQRIVIAAVTLLASSAASAAEAGFYFGLFGGQAKYDFDTPQIPVATLPPGGVLTFPGGPGVVTSPRIPLNPFIDFSFVVAAAFVRPSLWYPSGDDKDTAWGGLAGYRIARYAAVELSYLDLGTLEANDPAIVSFSPVIVRSTLHRELQTRGPSASVLGVLPVSDNWELYLRAGVLFADIELTFGPLGPIPGSSTTYGDEAALWGGGVQFNWGGHWSARLDFQRFVAVGVEDREGDADIDLLSLGVLYRL